MSQTHLTTHQQHGGDHHPDNLLLLSRRFHTLAHTHRWRLSVNPDSGEVTATRTNPHGQPVTYRSLPRGTPLTQPTDPPPEPPPPAEPPDPDNPLEHDALSDDPWAGAGDHPDHGPPPFQRHTPF